MYHSRETAGAPGAPLILTFHGTGGSENQFHGMAEQILPGAHVVSPRGDVSEGGMARYFRRTGEGVYDMDDLWARVDAMAAFIRDTAARVGAADVRAFGYSNGANILAAVGFRYPGLVGRVGLLHPLIPFAPDPQPGLAGVPVLVTAGQRDPICPAPGTRALLAWYRAQGADVTEHWHPGGHEIDRAEIAALTQFLQD
ncbi:MAG: alpha/beta hydrolase [Rhodobacteraceae bacterium]|jgi:phospholipase/carboxylesterase|nr:alpha/beta hydrolase [Paracoccaceae bacterium]